MNESKERNQGAEDVVLTGIQKDLLFGDLTERSNSEPIPCDFLKQKHTGCSREWTQSIEPHFQSTATFENILKDLPLVRTNLKMGIELEILLFDATTLLPLGAEGTAAELLPGAILKAMAQLYESENPRLITEQRDGQEVVYGLFLDSGLAYSLEPGGQFEVATPPRAELSEVLADMHDAFLRVEKVTQGRVLFLSHGTSPLTDDSFALQIPKKRYRILTRYLESEPGGRGVHMMRHATTVQPNIDVGPLASDWEEAVRLTYDLSPFFKAFFPNSFFFQTRFIADGLERQRIWSSMDGSRTGVPTNIMVSQDPSCAYAQWASQAFVFLIDSLPESEQPQYGELRFCEWYDKGYKGTKPSLADWERHLATLFPELRLRGFLELRMFDAQPFEMILPLLAFVRGILQSRSGRKQARQALNRIMSLGTSASVQGQFELLLEAAKVGLIEIDGGDSDAQGYSRFSREEVALKLLGSLVPTDAGRFSRFESAQEFVRACSTTLPSEAFVLKN